jgi:hypothetical protein
MGGMLLANRRLRATVELGLGGGVLLAGTLGLPLGLASVASAPAVGAGYAVGPAGPVAPLAALAIRALSCLPLADLATRANLASLAAATLAAAWLARLTLETLADVTPTPTGEGNPAAPPEDVPTAVSAARPVAAAVSGPVVREGLRAGVSAARPVAVAVSGPVVREGLRAGVSAARPVAAAVRGPTVRDRARGITAAETGPDGTAALRTGPSARDGACEGIAAAAGTGCVMFGLGLFLAATSAAGTAATLAVLAAFWLRALRLVRFPGSGRDGLGMALLAGLALGADAVAVLAAWPVALVLGVRSFRRGERWVRLAPLLALAGAGVSLYAAAVTGPSEGAAGWAQLALAGLRGGWLGPGLGEAAGAALGDLGAIAALAAVVGAAVLATRARAAALMLATAAAAALLAGAGGDTSRLAAASTARVVALASLVVPVGVGIAHLAGKLGPARAATALVIGVVAMGWPALDGGARRWVRPAVLPEQLLRQAHADLPPGAQVSAGSRPMDDLLRYGRALGLRPDLTLPPPPPAPSAAPADPPPPGVAAAVAAIPR